MIKMIIKDKNKLKLNTKSKILVLGLILLFSVGLFSPITTIAVDEPLGTCREGTAGEPQQNITQKDCEDRNANKKSDEKKWIWISYYYTLAPLPCENGTAGCIQGKQATYDPTQNNNIGTYLNLMIKLFIGICAVLAVIMIVMGGIEYMTTELISGKEAGKERITHAILGLLLALGAWTILNQINPNILNTDLKSLENVTVEVELNSDIPQAVPANGIYSNGSKTGDDWTTKGTPLVISGVSLNNGGTECSKVGQMNCTSTRGLDPSIVNATKLGCNCQLMITGGTEFWRHSVNSSHKPGSPTVDLRTTTELTNYITNGKTPTNMTVYSKNGISYLYEGTHWHVYK